MPDPLWLLRGEPDAPGWDALQADAMAKRVKVLHFDRDRWALVKAADPPGGYEGLDPTEPPDGLYLDNYGRPCYVVGRREVHSARAVVRALGTEAEALLDKLGDPHLVLERLGRCY
jgi:hypothetical protein